MEATTRSEAGSAAGDGVPPTDTEAIEVRRPADGSLITTVPIDPPGRVDEVVARVRAAQPEWEALGVSGRRRWLARLRDWLIANGDRVADVMQAETGKVRADAEIEAPLICDVINFYGANAARFLADETPRPHLPMLKVKRLRVVYRPYQVVGNISPWNFPLILSFDDSIAALQAGAAVVIKPSEFAPMTTMELVRAWKEEIGGPDVLDVVNGVGETGGALVDACDFIQFTGSERTGKVVMKRAAETLTPVSLELGGKDPMIVLRDANVERAVNGAAYGGLVNTGQACTSIERVYVEEPIYDEFVSRLTERVTKLRQGGDGRSCSTEIGAMTTPAQLEKVSEQVEDARQKGARVLTGGRRGDGPGDWYEPTVIADADHSMKVMREETFGPVVPVMKVGDADEAVRMANDTTYGLGGAVFTREAAAGERIARRVEAGTVAVNDLFVTNYSVLGLPMGGWKSSGIGYRHGAVGIRKFCRTESITVPRIRPPKREFLWFPYSRRQRGMIRRLYRLLNARGIRNRLGL
jgi:acyl-CoA reductase-like NAD-dependent aldehyde dehydrogenase